MADELLYREETLSVAVNYPESRFGEVKKKQLSLPRKFRGMRPESLSVKTATSRLVCRMRLLEKVRLIRLRIHVWHWTCKTAALSLGCAQEYSTSRLLFSSRASYRSMKGISSSLSAS